MNLYLKAKYEEDKALHENKRLEIEFEAIDRRNKQQEMVEFSMTKIQDQIREIKEIFCQTSANPKRMKKYDKMRQEDAEAMIDLGRLKLERGKCEQELVQLQNKLMDVEMEFGQKLCQLRQERKRMESIYWKMKETTYKESARHDQNRLREMAMVSDRAIKVTCVVLD